MPRLPYVSPQALVLMALLAAGAILIGTRSAPTIDWAGREAHLARPDHFARVTELALPSAAGPLDPQPPGLRLLLTQERMDVDDIQLWLQAGPDRPEAPVQVYQQTPGQASALALAAAQQGATAALVGADLIVPFGRVAAAGHAAQGAGLAVRALVAVGDQVQSLPMRFLADCDPLAIAMPAETAWGDVVALALAVPAPASLAVCAAAP